MTVHFDEAWASVLALAGRQVVGGKRLVVVRDLLGRVTIVVDDSANQITGDELHALGDSVRGAAGAFAAGAPVVLASQLVSPGDFFESPDLIRITVDDPFTEVAVIERNVVGGGWTRVASSASTRRVTMYGFKGGIGRSTAAFMLSRHLAAHGMCVLVVDLDLESPGIGALLQHEEDLPDFGLVDVMTETAVGNPIEFDFVVRSAIDPIEGNGEVWLAPAGGRPRAGYTYLPKLNRVYLDLASADRADGMVTFAERLESAISACEAEVARLSRPPDVVLLDSRAGIHDIAAAAITQLSDLSLLFATNSPQTWSGYQMLFSQWQASPELARRMRLRLKMVASMVPNREVDRYLSEFRDAAQLQFSESLYDDVAAEDDAESEEFNPTIDDVSAPHFPLHILFNRDLVGLDPRSHTDWHRSDLVIAAYSQFLRGAAELIVDVESSGDEDGET